MKIRLNAFKLINVNINQRKLRCLGVVVSNLALKKRTIQIKNVKAELIAVTVNKSMNIFQNLKNKIKRIMMVTQEAGVFQKIEIETEMKLTVVKAGEGAGAGVIAETIDAEKGKGGGHFLQDISLAGVRGVSRLGNHGDQHKVPLQCHLEILAAEVEVPRQIQDCFLDAYQEMLPKMMLGKNLEKSVKLWIAQ